MITVLRIRENSTRHYVRSRFLICLVIPDVPRLTASLGATTERSKKSSLTTTWISSTDKPLFYSHLAEYLLFYNTKRIHKSLGKMTQLTSLSRKGYVAFVWNLYIRLTYTRYCGLITETSFNNTNYWNTRRLPIRGNLQGL